MPVPRYVLEARWLSLLDRLSSEVEANYTYLRRITHGHLGAERMRFTVALVSGMALRQLRAARAVVVDGWGLESMIYARAVVAAAYDLAFLLSTSGAERREQVNRYLQLRWLRSDEMSRRVWGQPRKSRHPELRTLLAELREQYADDPGAHEPVHWSGLPDAKVEKRARKHFKTFLPEEMQELPKIAHKLIGTVGSASVHASPAATTLVLVGSDGLPRLEPRSPLDLNALHSHCVAATLLLAAITQRTTREHKEYAAALYEEVGALMGTTADEIVRWTEAKRES